MKHNVLLKEEIIEVEEIETDENVASTEEKENKVGFDEFCSIYRQFERLRFISDDEAKVYWNKWAEGNEEDRLEVRKRIEEAYLYFLNKSVRKFRHWGMTQDDFIQAGYLGIRRALKKFDPSLGIKFESWLSNAVGWAILGELANYDPRYKQEKVGGKKLQIYKAFNLEDITDEEMGRLLDYVRVENPGHSLEEPVSDNEKRKLHEIKGGPSLEEKLVRRERKRKLLTIVRKLEFPLRNILFSYFYREKTFDEIGEIYNIGSRQNVQQRWEKICDKLGKNKILRQFWEEL